MIVKRLSKSERAATTIEFALALPVLATVMVGILQLSLVLYTSGVLRHALGEGIRYAKVNPELSDQTIIDYTRDRLPSVDGTGITSLTFQRGTDGGADYGMLAISYQMTPVVPFIPSQTIVLNESKRAYLPN